MTLQVDTLIVFSGEILIMSDQQLNVPILAKIIKER